MVETMSDQQAKFGLFRAHKCEWPVETNPDGLVFCGDTDLKGKSAYCDFHFAQAYRDHNKEAEEALMDAIVSMSKSGAEPIIEEEE